MKKFIKCLSAFVLVLGVLGLFSGYAENINKRALLMDKNKQSLVVYQAPITRHSLFH